MSAQESIDNLRKVVRQSYEDEIAYLRAENAALKAAVVSAAGMQGSSFDDNTTAVPK